MLNPKKIIYRKANIKDLKNIQNFVDYWLSGRAKSKGIINAGNDYFVTTNQHRAYLKKAHVLLAINQKKEIIAWAVKERTNVLIHMLVAANMRGLGIGKKMLKMLNPEIIRSKTDQTTGDPYSFYAHQGYMRICDSFRTGRKKNIELLVKKVK